MTVDAGGLEIRTATPADAPALAEVAAVTFPLACPPGTAEEDIAAHIAETLSVARFTEHLADPQRILLIAELDGRPAGYTMLVLGDPDDAEVEASLTARPTAELSKCYVLADHHGQGVASALIEATVDRARGAGAAAVWLGVNQHNARANRFYERSGFALVGEKRFRLGADLQHDFVRERVLDDGAAGAAVSPRRP